MKKYHQLITDPVIGDCFRACMATLLQLPPQVLPNDFSPAWHPNWQNYLKQFGLALSPQNRPDQPIWYSSPWIASVKSLNFEGGVHAILMHEDGRVLHDPSNKKRYKTGSYISVKDNIILGGRHLIVTDASLLGRLNDYQTLVNKVAL